MRTVALLTALCSEVDAQMGAIPTPPEAHRWPSAVVTLGLWHARTGVGNRACSRWVTRDSRALLPRLPARTQLLRLYTTPSDWTQVFVAVPTVLGIIDMSGVEVIRPRREGHRSQQISRTSLSNHRWMVGGQWCRLLHQWGLMVGWAYATAKVADTTVQWCMRQAVDGRHQALQHRVKELASLCWVMVGQACHRALEVGEQHGDLLALAFQSAAGGQNLLGKIGGCVGEGRPDRCFNWRGGHGVSRTRVTHPDQDCPVLIGREPLALDKLVFERGQVRVIELKLQLEGPIRQAAPLAQEGDRLIHHRDKVHPVSSLPGARPLCPCATPS